VNLLKFLPSHLQYLDLRPDMALPKLHLVCQIRIRRVEPTVPAAKTLLDSQHE